MLPREQGTFKIYRHYSRIGKKPKLMAQNLNWERTQAWCNDPKTSKAGEWFDGFQQIA